jgi:CheY-like chemotaxis protein
MAASKKILIIDDESDALWALSEILRFEGFSVTAAWNGSDALNKLKRGGPVSLILLDLWMPVMNGFEFLRQKQSDASMAAYR